MVVSRDVNQDANLVQKDVARGMHGHAAQPGRAAQHKVSRLSLSWAWGPHWAGWRLDRWATHSWASAWRVEGHEAEGVVLRGVAGGWRGGVEVAARLFWVD